MKQSIVTYVIHSICKTYIKIGISRDVEQRFKSFKTSVPFELVVIRTFDCDIEKLLFAKFSHLRLQGEWFKYDAEIIEYVTSDRVNELMPVKQPVKIKETYKNAIENFENKISQLDIPVSFIFPVGKYKGKCAADVYKQDRSYFNWFKREVYSNLKSKANERKTAINKSNNGCVTIW